MRQFIGMLTIGFAVAFAGAQTWIEDGDAFALLPGQLTVGPGTLTTISGVLTSGSDVDLYAIYIDEPASFSAQTCGGTSIDSCLYLFDESGNGVAMSEDGCGIQSWITSQFVTTAGLYYIAMTAYDYDPLNDAGLEIWNDAPWGTERAPDGPGAPGPLASWGGSAGGSGGYNIALTGTLFAEDGPPPPMGACCFPNGQCAVLTSAACTGLGGTYYGDDTSCDPNPCPEPLTGACCFATTGCLELTQSFCEANGGVYQGDHTTCWPNPCGGDPGGGWSDDFDSYEADTVLYHVGGWSGWDDNPAAAGIVRDAQAHSAPHAIAVSGTADAIHPFTGVEGGQWIFTAWQYIPSGLSGMTYFILNSYYQHGGPYYWTVELHFDPTTGQVTDGIRDTSGASPLPIIYDQWVEIRCEIDISSGLGWVDQYYNGALLYSGDWITGPVGQLAIGNVDLYAPHDTVVYYDDLSLEPDTGGQPPSPVRPLFVGVQYGSLPTRTTNLEGFPDVTWNNGFTFELNGAAGRPDGALYLSSGDFNTDLYIAPLEGPAIYLAELEQDVSALAYGRGRLFGFCNYASPMGIYEINPSTGDMALLVGTGSRRFFGLDYNAADGLLYGYDEYGSPSGLVSIDLDTGQMTHVASSVPADNSAARGLACGYNKVYAVTVYGAEYPMFMYDLAQGPGGTWTPMTHPFPDSNATSGAAWIPGPVTGDLNCDGAVDFRDINPFVLALSSPTSYAQAYPDCTLYNADINLDGLVDFRDINPFVVLLSGK